jgi:hypothetical protein
MKDIDRFLVDNMDTADLFKKSEQLILSFIVCGYMFAFHGFMTKPCQLWYLHKIRTLSYQALSVFNDTFYPFIGNFWMVLLPANSKPTKRI